MDWVGVGKCEAHQGVPTLVVGGDLLLVVAHHPALALGTGDHPVDGLLEFRGLDQLLVTARRQQGGLVDQVGEIGAGESGGLAGDRLHVHVLGDRLALGVDLEDGSPAPEIGTIDHHLAVETARPEQRRVEDVGPVGGGDHDDPARHVETVQFHEQLVQRLLPLVVASSETGAPVPSHRVDLVDEDDRRRRRLGLLEEVTDPAGAHAHEHLDEVRSRDREERHTGLTGYRPGQEGLARTGRPVEEYSLRDLGAHRPELLRGRQEVLYLPQLLDGLLEPGHVLEGDLGLVLRHLLGLGLAELHDPASTALHLHDHEDHETEDQEPREEPDDQIPEAGGLRIDDHLDIVAEEHLGERSLVLGRVENAELGRYVRGGYSGSQHALDGVGTLEDGRFCYRAVLDQLFEDGQVDLTRFGRLVQKPLAEQHQCHHHETVQNDGAGGLAQFIFPMLLPWRGERPGEPGIVA